MAKTVVEAVALDSGNVEILGMVPDEQVEVLKKGNEVFTPIVNRPSRLRKTVDRFVVSSKEEKKPKKFTVEKGRGAPLIDIPNVVSRIRKRSTPDDIITVVHTLLYGKKAKGYHRKNNILQFSGFVWGENEEKLKGKLQDKLHKYNKEMLSRLCDLLDIPVSKSSAKKGVLVAKLIQFLESPYVSTDLFVSEKTQKETARKRKRKSSGIPAKIPNEDLPRKRQKSSVITQKEKGQPGNENREEDAKGENDSSVVDYVQEVELEEGKGKKDNVASVEKFNSEEKEVANNHKMKTENSLDSPSGDDLRFAISEIIAEVADFQTTTYRDITKKLELRFGIDFSERTVELRRMIQRELIMVADNGDVCYDILF